MHLEKGADHGHINNPGDAAGLRRWLQESGIELDESALGAGHVTVKYDKCMVDAAQQAWGQVSGQQPPTIIGQTFGWYEVVR